jgi:hypothetical protein
MNKLSEIMWMHVPRVHMQWDACASKPEEMKKRSGHTGLSRNSNLFGDQGGDQV